jgi:elongator complex protein 4
LHTRRDAVCISFNNRLVSVYFSKKHWKPNYADPGTRPGLHGQTLVSTGHPDLDRHLGGGLPLGSLLLLLEDGWSGHGTTLLRYFLAEGAACGQVGPA